MSCPRAPLQTGQSCSPPMPRAPQWLRASEVSQEKGPPSWALKVGVHAKTRQGQRGGSSEERPTPQGPRAPLYSGLWLGEGWVPSSLASLPHPQGGCGFWSSIQAFPSSLRLAPHPNCGTAASGVHRSCPFTGTCVSRWSVPRASFSSHSCLLLQEAFQAELGGPSAQAPWGSLRPCYDLRSLFPSVQEYSASS